MWRFQVLCVMFLIFHEGFSYFDYGISCTPGSEWSTGECGQKCRCLRRGVTHCTPNPCVLVKHGSNGEVKVKEMIISNSGVSIGRDITRNVDRRNFFPDKSELHKRFLNFRQ